MKTLRIFLCRVGFRDVAQNNVSPPLGLLYLAAYARQRFDVDIRVVDQRLENWPTERLAREIIDFAPDIVGFGSVTMSAHVLPDLVAAVLTELPNALTVLGGPYVTAGRDQALRDTGAHAGVVGEGEAAFERLIQAYLAREGERCDLSGIPGLLWREADGQIVANPGCLPCIETLDSLPFPAYDLIDIKRYWEVPSSVVMPGRKYICLLTSRGCPFRCFYCHNVFGKRFRGHSPERIVEEVAHVKKQYGVNDIEIVDDIFNYDYDRALEFCELAQKRALGVKYAMPNGVRTDSLSAELIDALVDTGLYFCSFALESASPRIQKLMGKYLNIPAFLDNVRIAANRGVFCNGFAMLGFPTETEDELKLTVDTMCGSRLHIGQFQTVTPFPGNDLYELVKREMPERLSHLDFSNATYYSIKVNLSAVPDTTLFRYQREAYRRFYLNPARMFRIVRAHPNPLYLFSYAPLFLQRTTKGLFGGGS